MNQPGKNVHFLEHPSVALSDAHVCILPLPFEGTVSYGSGTAAAPKAVIDATEQVELLDDEIGFDLTQLKYHVASPIAPHDGEHVEAYLKRVDQLTCQFHSSDRLIIGIGGEHSLTPSLVYAAAENSSDLSDLTVVQIDAHTDLRDTYEGTPHSHACAMRRLTERGARVISVGIRAMSQPEDEYAKFVGLIDIYRAQSLAEEPNLEQRLIAELRGLTGDVYLTVDIDGLDPSMCPGTGTPEPGGLGWWQTLRILRSVLLENRTRNLIGCDIVETVPQPNTQLNEFTAARLLAKVIAYAKAPRE